MPADMQVKLLQQLELVGHDWGTKSLLVSPSRAGPIVTCAHLLLYKVITR